MFSTFFKAKPVTAEDKITYRNLCVRFADILKKAGVPREVGGDEECTRLKKHPRPHTVIAHLQVITEVMESALEQGEDLWNDKMLIWRLVKKLGLRPCSDLMDTLNDGDVIQIFDTEHWMIFGNLRLFDLIDATVDEIATFNWEKDSRRKPSISLEAFRLMVLMKSKLLRRTFYAETIPPHEALFRYSNRLQKFLIDLRFVSPIWRGQSLVGYLVTLQTKALPVTEQDTF